MRTLFKLACFVSAFSAFSAVKSAEPLPNTKPLTEDGDLAAKMVQGIHKYLDREIAASPKARDAMWKVDKSSPEAFAKSVAPHRDSLKKLLGLVDQRVPPRMEYISGPGESAVIAECDAFTVSAVRWAVLPGIDGEGLLLEPKGKDKIIANVVVIPDALWTPEQIAGLTKDAKGTKPFAARLADSGCRVVIPVLIDRNDNLSANAKLNRTTNIPHREFIHRMAYEMGRTLVGFEVQKVLAAVDWFHATDKDTRIGVMGVGEGGRIALYAAAVDARIKDTQVSCAFGPREAMFDEPIDRNFWGALNEFGDAEVAALVQPRTLHLYPTAADKNPAAWPTWDGPILSKQGRGQAAPGILKEIPAEGVIAELKRSRAMFPRDEFRRGLLDVEDNWYGWHNLLDGLAAKPFAPEVKPVPALTDSRKNFDPAARHKRQFDQLVAFTQKLWRDSDAGRKEFWKKADVSSVAAWEKSTEWYREYFHTEVIGKLPEPTIPLNPRTRQVYDEPTWTGYEVMLDVYPDVFAEGILLLPKGMKPGEKRPVIVCQHGLEGRPVDTINVEKRPVYNHFSRRLVELGYIVYAPQNPYIGKTDFRQIQRKAQPLKLALFSFIIRQHQRTIDWLETLPNVDAKKIAFYGLSYGGKTAMRVPAVEKRYCLSICSADFNEWIGKNVSIELPMSYMWTNEYDMYEFDLGNTFNYAEMAFLIAPRPFMVERGHDDGVGTDEMVAYEYAKIRYLYQNRLKIPDRTTIEFFAGVHEIHAKGTFEFLKTHLAYPK
ncbi:MAG: dienelactone hydrolase family protein [Planctomycetes bacterium]|nr:dienelactone hydrolase family protein [Planctomycetota bacterium]